jgi:polyisoprenoid-binding protein YceI
MKPRATFPKTRSRPTLLARPGLLVLLAVLLAGTAAPVAAEELTLTLDPEATALDFTLGAFLHTVEGGFRLEQGELVFDPETGDVSGRVVVDATSGDTGNDKRDRDMHGKLLESETYPEFVLVPTRLEGTFELAGASEVTLHGTLQIHGGEHEIAIPATVAVHPAEDGGYRLEATGTFEVPYVEWGLKDPSKFLLRVAKSVGVTIHAEGRIER